MFVSFWLHLQLKPYTEPMLDRLELLSMSGSVLTLWIGIFFYLGTPDEVEIILSLFIVIFNALLCAEFAMSIAKEMLRAQLVAGLPAGARASSSAVDEDALSDHVIYFSWPRVEARADGCVKSMHAFLLVRLIVWMEHGRRTARQVREDVPDTLARMQRGAAAHEYARRAKNANAWVAGGLIDDADMATWLCAYESRGREPASLDALVTASLVRDAIMPPYLAAMKAGEAHLHQFETEFILGEVAAAGNDDKKPKKSGKKAAPKPVATAAPPAEELSRKSGSAAAAEAAPAVLAVENAPSQV
jgi:hypothetical protein